MKRSKKYKKALENIDKSKEYTLEEAIELLPKVNICSFDSSVDIHLKIRLKEKQKKLSIKGSTKLPNKVGQSVRIAVITTNEHQEEAKSADIVGGEDLIQKIEKGEIDFDILIATPDIMAKVAKLGRILGPKGKMPNPKNGTVTTDLDGTIESYKEGKTNFKVDKQGGIHMKIGSINMEKEKLQENIITFLKAVYQEIKNLNPVPFKSIILAPSMGPSIKLDVNEVIKNLT